MYCKRCYADLTLATETWCRSCGRLFNPNDSSSFLTKPFPRRRKIIFQIIFTTILGILVAFVVAMFQQPLIPSGH